MMDLSVSEEYRIQVTTSSPDEQGWLDVVDDQRNVRVWTSMLETYSYTQTHVKDDPNVARWRIVRTATTEETMHTGPST